MTRLSDLVGKKVRTEGGLYLGRVHEVRARQGQVIALIYGTSGFLGEIVPHPSGTTAALEACPQLHIIDNYLR